MDNPRVSSGLAASREHLTFYMRILRRSRQQIFFDSLGLGMKDLRTTLDDRQGEIRQT